uniref:Cadherin domain-containing protein n=1 Tax=Sphenodon punctatus TaxID=8508 RepID=A0A8D0HBN5_SPHPU
KPKHDRKPLRNRRQVLSFCLCLCLSRAVVCESLRYSVPEEEKSGSLVANVLKDLNLDAGDLSARRARLVSKSSREYFQLNPRSGDLTTKEAIDREALCGRVSPCLLQFEIMLENPLQMQRIEVRIEDVNDNAPKFSTKEFVLEMPELIPPNTRFPLERAQDSDIGINGIQSYTLGPSETFGLQVQSRPDGTKYAELVLETPLDREQETEFNLILTAVDGGSPQRTGTAAVHIHVLDANDNFPQFSQSVYKAQLQENSPQGTLLCQVEASDADHGSNAQITYSFSQLPDHVVQLFTLNQLTGEIRVTGSLDFEEAPLYELDIQATDGGGLSAHCKVLLEIQDRNDNAPEVTIVSLTSPIPEDAAPGTVVALFSVQDRDSGDNGRTVCSLDPNVPFTLRATLDGGYYELVTQGPLDREQVPRYNLTLRASDRGSPRLQAERLLPVWVSDVNDNPPVFAERSYLLQVRENNAPALLIGSVRAADPDTELNARVTYSLLPGRIGERPASSYISINPETGSVFALRSLDYEQLRGFQVAVRAADGGAPPLSSEVSVRVVVLDENDNVPFILSPLQNSTVPASDLVPRAAEAGYLVTKVVAVDADSGQNAWLSYQLLKATDPALFTVGAQNGEVRTTRPLSERDAFKHKLVIAVRDNGQLPRSATATLSVLLVEGFSEAYMQLPEPPREDTAGAEGGSLTVYLVIALAAISFLFLGSGLVLVALKVHKGRVSRQQENPASSHCPGAPSFPENGEDSRNGSLCRAYHYDVCLTTGSLSSDFQFLGPLFPNFSVEYPISQGNPRISTASQGSGNRVDERESAGQVRGSFCFPIILSHF